MARLPGIRGTTPTPPLGAGHPGTGLIGIMTLGTARISAGTHTGTVALTGAGTHTGTAALTGAGTHIGTADGTVRAGMPAGTAPAGTEDGTVRDGTEDGMVPAGHTAITSGNALTIRAEPSATGRQDSAARVAAPDSGPA